jgi:hypothetical protein
MKLENTKGPSKAMKHSRARPVTLMVTAVIAAGLLAACGSSSSTSSTPSAAAGGSSSGATGAAGAPANRAKLEACLKQHGVTLPTRPAGAGRTGGGGSGAPPSGQGGSGPPSGSGSGNRRGFFGGGGGGGFRANPKLRAAFQACGGVRGGFGRRGGSALSHASIQKFVTCVRQHGYNLPQPNFSGKGAIFPAKIESNAKFQSASRACRSQLTPSGGPPNGGAPPSGA